MQSEIIETNGIAKVIGCSPNQVRYNLREVWKFGRVVKHGNRRRYIVTISELSDYLQLSREEVIRRLQEK